MRVFTVHVFVFLSLVAFSSGQTPSPTKTPTKSSTSSPTKKPTSGSSSTKSPTKSPTKSGTTHAPSFVIKPPTKPSKPNKTKKPSSGNKTSKPSTATHKPTMPSTGKPHGGQPHTEVRKCMQKIKRTCNCGLILKGSQCPRETAKKMCNLPHSRHLRPLFTNLLARKARKWCNRLVRNGNLF